MDLTPKWKQRIDGLTVEQLLRRWRNAPIGDAMFQGETGEYWNLRMAELRARDPEAYVEASKRLMRGEG